MGDWKQVCAAAGFAVSQFQPIDADLAPELEGLVVSGAHALNAVRQLRRLSAATGRYPVILGAYGGDGVSTFLDMYSLNADSVGEQAVAFAQGTDFADLTRQQRERCGLAREEGAWPDPLPPIRRELTLDHLTLVRDILTWQLHAGVLIALAPAADACQIPLALRFGGFNDCPPAAVHGLYFRQWQAEYGAEIVGLDGATLEVEVQRRPADRAAALALAQLQFDYCPDIVLQGVGSIQALAAQLLTQPYWYFWWD